MIVNETAAKRYAQAVFELAAQSDSVRSIGEELRVLSGAVYADASTKEFFLSPVVDRSQKIGVLSVTLSSKVSAIALNTLLLLVRKRREALLPEIVRQYETLEMQSRGAQPLTITSAKELSPQELGAMVARLQGVYKTTFDVTQNVDPSLIGGVRITMGDRLVDGSIQGRLEELARKLFTRN